MNKIDVYDFDGTIYNGDSTIDFFIYAIKKKKRLIRYLPKISFFLLLKIFRLVSTKKFKEVYFSFLKEINNQNEFVKEFWKIKEEKINSFFLRNVNENKIIYVISASPEFLLKPYLSKFKNVKLIATKMDKNGKIEGENCKGEEKVKLLHKEEKDFTIENFYTDSLADMPLVQIAKKSYHVNKGKVEEWNKHSFY